jgi:adenosine deaminase
MYINMYMTTEVISTSVSLNRSGTRQRVHLLLHRHLHGSVASLAVLREAREIEAQPSFAHAAEAARAEAPASCTLDTSAAR